MTIRIVLAALLAVFALPALAQSRACNPRGYLVDRLEKSFQETPRAFGLVGPRAIVELFVSGLGSWTIIVTGTDGISCVLAAGEGWEDIPLELGTEL